MIWLWGLAAAALLPAAGPIQRIDPPALEQSGMPFLTNGPDGAAYLSWIDPEKEANASEVLERNVYDSAPAIIRRRGGSPADVIAQTAAWQRRLEKAGIDKPEPQQREQAAPQRETA